MHLGFDASSGQMFRLDAARLTTHGVVVGMTGSGKTGLCITLLEEAAAAKVPVIAIDPKGDLVNLARPWPADGEATWREGLAASGVSDERVAALRGGVDVRVLTPGSAVAPIDVFGALAAPAGADDEALADAATTAAAGVLGLAGIVADPLRDPRAVLLATLVRDAWQAGQGLDPEQLVLRLVDPPFAKVGVFPVDTFVPRADRLALAMALNAVLAAPTAGAWRAGEAMDVDAWLAPSPDGRTPVRVVYLAHLDDASRSFVLTLLLGRIVAWSRRQPGASGLRALLFFDEVYGFLPPHPHDPPTKRPLLTLLKQARAVGLGVLLCTQNPVVLDYKALSNAGFWAVGRLSTPQDRARVLDGLGLDAPSRQALDASIASLPPRSFAIHDVREPGPRVLRVRFAISWLAGPRTLAELRAERPSPPSPPSPAARAAEPVEAAGILAEPPVLDPAMPVRWWSDAGRFGAAARARLGEGAPRRPDGRPEYAPALLADITMRFEARGGFHHQVVTQRLFAPLAADAPAHDLVIDDFVDRPASAGYQPLPDDLDEARELKAFVKRIQGELLAEQDVEVYRHPFTKLQSRGGETRDAFAARVDAAVDDQIDAAIAKLRAKVEKEVDRLEARREALERDVLRRRSEAQAKLATEVVGAGEMLFGMLFGRSRSVSAAVGRRASTSKANQRAADAADDLEALGDQIIASQQALEAEIRDITASVRAEAGAIVAEPVRLSKSGLDVRWTMLWVPARRPV